MSTTLPPTYPMPMPYPINLDCLYNNNNKNNFNNDSTLLNSIQHQSIDKNISDSASSVNREVNNVDRHLSTLQQFTDKNITDSAFGINREVNSVDKHLIDGVCKINDSIAYSTGNIRDNMNSSTLGLRDSIERNATNVNSNLTNSFQDSADRARDIQVSVERTSQAGTHATERNASLLLQSIERNAGETRYTSAVGDAANRQATNDLARDIIGNVNKSYSDTVHQLNRNDSEILNLIQATSAAGVLASTSSGYEIRTLANTNAANTNSLINSVSAGIQASICGLGSQSSQQFAALLLEQHKVKEHLSTQLADAKYEALKNKEGLSSQLAASSAETKYEALKNTQAIQNQLSECCCELKSKIDCVGNKVDDTLRTLDTQRIRDQLNAANNEVNLLKITELTRSNIINAR